MALLSPVPSSLAEVIAAEGGQVTFARFMEMALTHPTLGYYSRADRLLRHGGDFSTAPAISPFFNRTLARLVTELVDASLTEATIDRPSVVELGGGEGHLAEAVLRYWRSERPGLREKVAYRVLEVGMGLQRRQAAAVEELAASGWDIGWGADLEEACAGTRPVVIVGNEFLDAMPVHLVAVHDDRLREACVQVTHASLVETWGEPSAAAAAEIEMLFGTLDPRRLEILTQDGILEISPGLGELTRRVARVMPSGSFMNIDYGEWFPGLPQVGERWGLEGRTGRRRTVRGYFKHQMVLDPLARAGGQDLTADVDFAALDLHGRREGFETVLFTTLAAFLRGGGAEGELQALRAVAAASDVVAPTAAAADPLEADRQATVLRNLLDERDLGGAFKLMVQVRE
jgi:SAM-dependent MidA family methyltransferase